MKEAFEDYIRVQFPSLENEIDGHPVAFLDGPGGYQVPERVIKAAENYFVSMNANVGGAFFTSKRTDEMIGNARKIFAEFFNCSWEEVVFGANTTSLNFALSSALIREMEAGDKILITEIDHEANRGPWESLQERGVIVEDVKVDVGTCTLDMDDFQRKLTPNTKVVAVNYASNAVGTITDVEQIVNMAKEVGAYTVVDAVHYAAHKSLDVKEIGTDFLICSVYKFFGPHIGVMYAKKDVLSRLRPLKVRPQYNYPPFMIETGTLNQEGIAGAVEALKFVADLGEKYGESLQGAKEGTNEKLRDKIVEGFKAIERYEEELTKYLVAELSRIDEVAIFGPPEGHPRTPTVSFTYEGYTALQVAEYLGSKGIFVWDGDFYATRLVERLGLRDKGGLIRVGIAPYNTKEELVRLIKALKHKKSLEEFLNKEEFDKKAEGGGKKGK